MGFPEAYYVGHAHFNEESHMRYSIILASMVSFSLSAGQIKFGIVPQQSAKDLAKKWVPVCQYLSKETGLNITFSTAPDIPTFEKRLETKTYDIAYMNPYHFVVYHKKSQYQAAAKVQNKQIQGILVSKKNGLFHSPADLSKRQIAFPSPAAFAASILNRADLKLQNIEFTPRYVSSHDSVYRNVAKGIFAAGGGVMRTFNNLSDDIKNQLVVIHKTKQFTPHAFALSDSLDSVSKIKIQNALIKMGQHPKGKELLRRLGMGPLEKASNEDWDDVRAQNIDELD